MTFTRRGTMMAGGWIMRLLLTVEGVIETTNSGLIVGPGLAQEMPEQLDVCLEFPDGTTKTTNARFVGVISHGGPMPYRAICHLFGFRADAIPVGTRILVAD
jgi:hypothetical protein